MSDAGKLVRERNVSKGSLVYCCNTCAAVFHLKSYPSPYVADLTNCIFCTAANRMPTPKATIDQINEKKLQLRNRINKNTK